MNKIEIGPDGTPVVVKDTSSQSGGQSSDLTKSNTGFVVPSKQTGLEDDGIREAMDDVMKRVNTDEKATNDLNEAILNDANKTVSKESLGDAMMDLDVEEDIVRVKKEIIGRIKPLLKNGLDTQQQERVIKDIESILDEY